MSKRSGGTGHAPALAKHKTTPSNSGLTPGSDLPNTLSLRFPASPQARPGRVVDQREPAGRRPGLRFHVQVMELSADGMSASFSRVAQQGNGNLTGMG